jgi:hypothetical protein
MMVRRQGGSKCASVAAHKARHGLGDGVTVLGISALNVIDNSGNYHQQEQQASGAIWNALTSL